MKIIIRSIKGESFAEVGRKLGISRERARQIYRSKESKIGKLRIITSFPWSIELYHFLIAHTKGTLFQISKDRLLMLKQKNIKITYTK